MLKILTRDELIELAKLERKLVAEAMAAYARKLNEAFEANMRSEGQTGK